MRNTISILLLLLVVVCSAQWQNHTIQHQSINREYRIYVPTNYDESNPASLVFTLHGLGDNMTNFSGIGMNVLAESKNIIVVVPQAVEDFLVGTAWNSGAGLSWYTPNTDIDDVGFISTLIDEISSEYSIDPNKVFACGFSMGGFMTQRLALELNDKIKAFASVAGTIGTGILPPGNPGRAVSIAHFHGTSDSTVPYVENGWGMDVDDMISFWVDNNNTDTQPTVETFPNSANDGYTVDHYVYANGDDDSVVELFKVNNADHVWLTQANDISYTVEIWNFFERYIDSTLNIHEINTDLSKFAVYPNPARDVVYLNLKEKNISGLWTVTLIDISGKKLLEQDVQFTNGSSELRLSNFNKGIYIINLRNGNNQFSQKLIIK